MIYSTDELSKTELAKQLKESIDLAIAHHAHLFQDDATLYAKGIATNAASFASGGFGFMLSTLASTVGTIADVSMGVYKNSKALQEVESDVRNAINSISSNYAFNKDTLFKAELVSSFGSTGDYLYGAMGSSYANCAQVSQISSVQDFKGYDVKSVCDKVSGILGRNSYEDLRSYFKTSMSNMIVNIQKGIVHSAVAPGASVVGQESGKLLFDVLSKSLKEAERATQQEVSETAEDLPKRKLVDLGRVKKSFSEVGKAKPWVDPDTIPNELACIDIHGLLKDPVMAESAEVLFKYMLSKGMNKSAVLAAIGNSLIEIHNNPYGYAQPAALPLAAGAVATAVEACAANPACVNFVALTLTGAFTAGKIMVEGFDVAEEIDTTMWTPEHIWSPEMNKEFIPIHTDEGSRIFVTPEHKSEAFIESFPIHEGELHLIFEFKVDGKKFHEHHIISDKNKLTMNHKLWEKAGIDKQSRANKIYLPTSEEYHPTRAIHKGKHWESVSGNLGKKMDEAYEKGQNDNWTQNQYRDALNKIMIEERSELRSGNRALNKHHREWSNVEDKK